LQEEQSGKTIEASLTNCASKEAYKSWTNAFSASVPMSNFTA
jgi:hypothetical protein